MGLHTYKVKHPSLDLLQVVHPVRLVDLVGLPGDVPALHGPAELIRGPVVVVRLVACLVVQVRVVVGTHWGQICFMSV